MLLYFLISKLTKKGSLFYAALTGVTLILETGIISDNVVRPCVKKQPAEQRPIRS